MSEFTGQDPDIRNKKNNQECKEFYAIEDILKTSLYQGWKINNNQQHKEIK